MVRGCRVRGTSAVGSRYQATTGEHTASCEELVRAVANCRVCELAIALQLLVVMVWKCSVNPITNPNPVYSHTHTRDNIVIFWFATV
jgi:ribosomal protein L37AE/L43A